MPEYFDGSCIEIKDTSNEYYGGVHQSYYDRVGHLIEVKTIPYSPSFSSPSSTEQPNLNSNPIDLKKEKRTKISHICSALLLVICIAILLMIFFKVTTHLTCRTMTVKCNQCNATELILSYNLEYKYIQAFNYNTSYQNNKLDSMYLVANYISKIDESKNYHTYLKIYYSKDSLELPYVCHPGFINRFSSSVMKLISFQSNNSLTFSNQNPFYPTQDQLTLFNEPFSIYLK